MRRVYIVDTIEGPVSKARAMAHLTVRNVSEAVVDALKRRAAANNRTVEAEHRELLRAALLGGGEDFATWADLLRQRLRSSVDNTNTIHANRDGAV